MLFSNLFCIFIFWEIKKNEREANKVGKFDDEMINFFNTFIKWVWLMKNFIWNLGSN